MNDSLGGSFSQFAFLWLSLDLSLLMLHRGWDLFQVKDSGHFVDALLVPLLASLKPLLCPKPSSFVSLTLFALRSSVCCQHVCSTSLYSHWSWQLTPRECDPFLLRKDEPRLGAWMQSLATSDMSKVQTHTTWDIHTQLRYYEEQWSSPFGETRVDLALLAQKARLLQRVKAVHLGSGWALSWHGATPSHACWVNSK